MINIGCNSMSNSRDGINISYSYTNINITNYFINSFFSDTVSNVINENVTN